MLTELLLSVRTWTAVAILASVYYLLFRPRTPPAFPIVNQYPNDFFRRKAYREARENAKQLIIEGLAKHGGPITILIPHGQKIILPSSLTTWVKSNKDLDHKQLVREDFFSGIPGFEALSLLHDPDSMLINLITTKMGPNNNPTLIKAMHTSLSHGLPALWDDSTTSTSTPTPPSSWHPLPNWQTATLGVIARAASSVFAGPEKAADTEWLALVQGYVGAYFAGVADLHRYPRWARPVAHWFLPNAAACRRYVARARAVMEGVLRERAVGEGREVVGGYEDALEWAQEASGGRVQAGDVQLSLAMAALFTTTELFRALVVEMARRPELIGELRSEVEEQIGEHGISVAALSGMVLMDSFMKETQRLNSGPVALERVALKDITLPDGKVIPRGAHIMVDSTDLWNPAVYPNPDQFDARRFLRKRQEGDKASQFVQSSPTYNVFGGGRHICPGRFLASNELKLALAHILLKYDIRLGEGCEPKNLQHGFYVIGDPSVRLEVRRRDAPSGSLLLR
ncbi:cytochrome P450 [Chaetomium tenue]|uniref:Cytochrome P450 n=1 Tax=Chaetomium tenue TaxID=1854479 RepID=A0ACB7P9D3_9PEZI|nr:cytochrome P450 [Chaetomium globosum]